ncbi:hypothetical protein ERW49_18730 [Aliivibrio finisterrensis]|uniref:Uncharacterized protein n=1 Tax=Aliivibrio finisterrensis TaxID=511998 RepID=A0A4Q5K9B0_9GAMM|nr:hypothetical protein [Aliivibrio finisterrensis]RYU41315.1 hypothetical protein ERW49_18730 [Aliivibrio finisterrensis]
MATLLNKDGSVVPPRPDADDSEVKAVIIHNAVESIFSERFCDFEDSEKDDLLCSLTKHWYEGCDEFQLAKGFERDGWDVDHNFFEKLVNACCTVSGALRELIEVWGDENNIIPPYQIGEKLDIGVITGSCNYYPATYEVLIHGEPTDSISRRLIKFEDAVPCPLNKHEVISMNKQQRLEEANKLIKSISSYGCKFFSGKSGCASLGYGIKPRVFFTDAKTSALIETHEHEWVGFSHGGTLRVLIEYLRDYINDDVKFNIECICTFRSDGSNTWGYDRLEAEKLVNEVKGLDMFNVSSKEAVMFKKH